MVEWLDERVVVVSCAGACAASFAACLSRQAALEASMSSGRTTVLAHGGGRVTAADVETAGGALKPSDVGGSLADAVVRAVREFAKSSSREVVLSARRLDGELTAEAIEACGARAVFATSDGSSLSVACGISELCERVRAVRGAQGKELTFVYVSAGALTGTVFVDAGRRAAGERTLYEAVRPSSTAAMVEAAATSRDQTKCALHYEFLMSHPETAPLLGKSAVKPDAVAERAPATASVCSMVGAVAVGKVLRASASGASVGALQQWTHVEALDLYRPDRADAHAPPKPVMDEYQTLPSADEGGHVDMNVGDDFEGYENQANVYGYDAMNKLREMLVLVCGRDAEANDACATALASVGIRTVDIFGSSGSGRFLREECDVDDLCDLDDMESYKYHAIVRTSACAAADELIAAANEVRTPVIEITSAEPSKARVHVNLGSKTKFDRGTFMGWMDASTAIVAAHIAAMEVVRIAQKRERETSIELCQDGIFAA